MAKLIKTWEELDGLESENYKIEVDLDLYGGWILPKVETEETLNRENYWKHHIYLTTHTFYGSNYKNSTEILQEHGFDVELDNWDKDQMHLFK
jgi:hypothetical protein